MDISLPTATADSSTKQGRKRKRPRSKLTGSQAKKDATAQSSL